MNMSIEIARTVLMRVQDTLQTVNDDAGISAINIALECMKEKAYELRKEKEI